MMQAQGKSPRVRVVSGGPGDAHRYRCEHLYEQLSLAGVPCVVSGIEPGEPASIEACEILVLHRVPLDGYLRRLVTQLKQRGTVVLFDTDDLVFEVDESLGFAAAIGDDWLRRALYKEDLKGLRAAFELADGALVSTDYLASRARAAGKLAWVHRNAFSLSMLELSNTAGRRRVNASGRVVIGYASGTPTHERDFAQVRSAVQRILQRYPAAELRLIGHLRARFDWGEVEDRVTTLPFVPWQQLPTLLAEFDINLAPLEVGRPFCEAKSEIKYVEAALVAVPTVASSSGAFVTAIQDGSNGFLADSEERWFACLDTLVRDPSLRHEMGKCAHENVVARYHPAVRSAELLRVLSSVLGACRGDRQAEPAQPGDAWHEQATDPGPVNGERAARDRLRRRSSVSRAWYHLRYGSGKSFALRTLAFAARRATLSRSVAANAATARQRPSK